MRIGINGFGRIGRRVARLITERENMQLVAINDLAGVETMAHLLQYDSVHGRSEKTATGENGTLLFGNREIAYTSHEQPESIPWEDMGVEYVIEATGLFKTTERASAHLKPGVRHVIISAPATDEKTKTVALGFNDDGLSKDDRVISNASCTTNSAAPLVQLIDELCGIRSGYITTIHSYTTDQRLQDAPHRDLRRARAAAHSIVPTTTGAAKAITRIFPKLDGKLGGCGIRVPVPNGSLTDISYVVDHPVNAEKINAAFAAAAKGRLSGILQYTDAPIVSADIIGNQHSCVFDSQLTSVIDHMVKVVGWYDNETGYSARMLDLIEKLDRL